MQWLVGLLLASATAYVTSALTIDNTLRNHAVECPVCGDAHSSALAAKSVGRDCLDLVDPPSDAAVQATSIRLKSETDEPIPVARNLNALRQLSDALEWNWKSEVGRLIGSGEVILAQAGTRAELLTEETFYSKIRFQDAFGTFRVGYLISDSFRPQFIKLDQ